MREAWSEPTSWDEVCRRAAGRRHYNGVRRCRAIVRRAEVARLLRVPGALFDRGTQARLARQLSVSRSTICRDVAALMLLGRPCPTCGAFSTSPEPDFP
ncbi:MAG TPA: HTH domain-containing protein [Gemmataceae bacterium]|nr:HTH domain-containing protein [Gemmataceae bacterium]